TRVDCEAFAVAASSAQRERMPLACKLRRLAEIRFFYSITESRWRGASDSTRGASASRILPMSVKTTPLHCNIATRCRVSIRKFILQAVEITCQGHPAIVLFSPSMKILKFAALPLLVFGTIAANDVAPSNSELEAMYDKAYRAFDAANYVQALKELDAIDARKPDLAASQNLRGVVYMRQGLYDKAEAALSEARGLDPKFWNARFNLAEIPFLKKDWSEARKRFQELLSSNAAEL